VIGYEVVATDLSVMDGINTIAIGFKKPYLGDILIKKIQHVDLFPSPKDKGALFRQKLGRKVRKRKCANNC
jgi:hypothetical protein